MGKVCDGRSDRNFLSLRDLGASLVNTAFVTVGSPFR